MAFKDTVVSWVIWRRTLFCLASTKCDDHLPTHFLAKGLAYGKGRCLSDPGPIIRHAKQALRGNSAQGDLHQEVNKRNQPPSKDREVQNTGSPAPCAPCLLKMAAQTRCVWRDIPPRQPNKLPKPEGTRSPFPPDSAVAMGGHRSL